MSLGYVIVCLVRDELDVKYDVNLWENELKRISYGGDYHMGSLDPKVKHFVNYSHRNLSAIVYSILVLLWARSAVAQRSGGWAEFGGSLLLARPLKPPFPFPLCVYFNK